MRKPTTLLSEVKGQLQSKATGACRDGCFSPNMIVQEQLYFLWVEPVYWSSHHICSTILFHEAEHVKDMEKKTVAFHYTCNSVIILTFLGLYTCSRSYIILTHFNFDSLIQSDKQRPSRQDRGIRDCLDREIFHSWDYLMRPPPGGNIEH